MQPVEHLEQLLEIESHETVDEIQDYLLETVDGAKLDDTGCIYAGKNGVEDGTQLAEITPCIATAPIKNSALNEGRNNSMTPRDFSDNLMTLIF